MGATQMGPVSPWNIGCINYPFHLTNFSYSRCDQLPHCKDLSDEANCQLVILPEGYVLEYPPFSTDEEGLPIKVDVMIKMDLLSIYDINLVSQTFRGWLGLATACDVSTHQSNAAFVLTRGQAEQCSTASVPREPRPQ